MTFEAVNVIAGVVSAVCALISTLYLFSGRSEKDMKTGKGIIRLPDLMAFLLACSGWALICLCYLWFFEPFGSFVSDRDYRKFFAAILSVPALLVLSSAGSLSNRIRSDRSPSYSEPD